MREETWFDPENGTASFKESHIGYNLCGPLEDAIKFLEGFRGVGDEITLSEKHGYEGDSWLEITWSRKLRPEELAKRERDNRERDARYAAEREANERRQYEALKAKFEPK